MSRKKLSRNAPCPCGSGKKYKKCCYGKDFEFEEDDDGNIFKSVPITEDMAKLLKEQRRKFIEKYGRESGPNASGHSTKTHSFLSSTSRTLTAIALGVNGFCRKAASDCKTP